MGYADGYYYGQGRIICDTSTFSVGDTIRVRSMTDSNKVWNKTVATVGTALVFTVPCYDYYKICTVQDIGGTPTEIGGVYTTIDYGQTLYLGIADFNSNRLAYVQSVLNNHQENYALNIGDEKIIKINVGGTPTDWVMQIANIDGTNHAVDFVSKHIYTKTAFSSGRETAYSASPLRTVVQGFYSIIDNSDKAYIKEVLRDCRTNSSGNPYYSYSDYIWIPNCKEVSNTDSGTPLVPRPNQFPLFVTQSNRIKTYNGTAVSWWLSDATYGDSYYADYISSGGVYGKDGYRPSDIGVLPCFRLTADS